MDDHILSSYIGDIYFDFKIHEQSEGTILFLEGFPSKGRYSEEIKLLYDKGYNIIWPHYKGSYQSDGEFLKNNPVKELNEFIKELKKGWIINLWDLSKVKIQIKKLYLFGSSFSGAICCGLSTLEKFDKIVLFSPVWDFDKHNSEKDEQDLDKLVSFVKRAYKNLFRFGWNSMVSRFKQFEECSSDYYVSKLNVPLLVFHDPEDKTVSIKHTYNIVKKLDIELIEHDLGHSAREVLISKWEYIEKFLEKQN